MATPKVLGTTCGAACMLLFASAAARKAPTRNGQGCPAQPSRAAQPVACCHRGKAGRPSLAVARSGNRADVGRLRALGALGHVELHAGVFRQRAEAVTALDFAEMREQVLAAVVR